MMHGQTIEQLCANYIQEEPNSDYRLQIDMLLQSKEEKHRMELFDRMHSMIKFGTAGLRGRMEAGYNRMNKVSVYRLSYAVSQVVGKDRLPKKFVIGFDGRNFSVEFALEAAQVLLALGHEVFVFKEPAPTPLCAFATKHQKADMGIMITASHNPKADNGIKLYQHTSAQLHGAVLSDIEQQMNSAPKRCDFMETYQQQIRTCAPKEVHQSVLVDYLSAIQSTRFFDASCGGVKIVYTPLHGVGKSLFLRALSKEGFDDVLVVGPQAEPDGQFPTVSFPNPEESHTLDMAHRLAMQHKIPLVFANDPDADRLQVSSLDTSGSFRKLTGNEMGILLSYFSITRAKQQNIKPLLATSIVSSRMLKAMCEKMRAHYVEALTGFSNIVAAALYAEKTHHAQFVCGYEEAIGFLVGKVVLDKDGINAGARFMEIVSYLQQHHKTVWEFLDELYLQFGLYINSQWSVRFEDVSPMDAMNRIMADIRGMPVKRFAHCLEDEVCQKFDLNEEQENNSYKGLCANVVIFESKSARLIVRPSGTEPKIKFYLEVHDQATNQEDLSIKRLALQHKVTEYQSRIEILLGG